MAVAVPLFSYAHMRYLLSTGLVQYYGRLEDVTVATDYSAQGVRRLRTVTASLAPGWDFMQPHHRRGRTSAT